MSLYIIVWGLLCLFAAKGALVQERRTTARAEFWLCFLLLAGMLALRYGQGTDFFAYQFYYYEMSDTVFDFPLPDVHGEIGYQFLTNAFRLLHLPYEAFIFFLSVLQMGFLLAFFKRYHIDCVLALLLAMPTLYMTYFVSGLRQGVVLAAFLGVLFPLLEKKRYLAYLAGTLLCMLIHTVAVVFLLALLAQRIQKVSTLQLLTLAAWLLGAVIALPATQEFLRSLNIWALWYYLRVTGISWAAVAERLLFLALVTWLYEKLRRLGRLNDAFVLGYRCYLMAMALYGALIINSTTASRMASGMRYIEILLLVYAARQMTRASRCLLVAALIAVQSFMYVKNVHTFLEQGAYQAGLNVWNYPYVSVFNEEEIYQYRSVPHEYLDIAERRTPFTAE